SHMKRTYAVTSGLLIATTAGLLIAQSPPAETSTEIGGKKISIKYSAPSMRGRQIFGAGGVVSNDETYPVWRDRPHPPTPRPQRSPPAAYGRSSHHRKSQRAQRRLHPLCPGRPHSVEAHHQQTDRPGRHRIPSGSGPRSPDNERDQARQAHRDLQNHARFHW